MRIHPSILSADFGQLAHELNRIKTADAAHIDVMDNHFVPNLTIGLPVVKRLREISPIPLDVHLMITRADTESIRYAKLGVSSITIHLEACENPKRTIQDLKDLGVQVAVAIKPATPVESAFEFLPELDMLLIMTVEPGFGGQPMLDATLDKIPVARREIDLLAKPIILQVDGGVTVSNIGRLSSLGVDCVVAGSAVFDDGDAAENITALRKAASPSA
jgi:ribulose-phosphate 3-epimerase